MERTRVHFILFLTFISLPAVRSVTCLWADTFEFEGECFHYDSTKLTYSEAKDACQSKGGVLARVKSPAQLEESTKDIPDNTLFWIGANNVADEKVWMWEEGAVANLSELWMPSSCQPDNFNNDEHCAVFVKFDSERKGLHDTNCELFKFGFLCKELYTTSDTTSTTGTTNDPATTNTAAFTADTSATTNTVASTTDNSVDTNTVASTADTSAATITAASTADTSATTITAETTADTSAATITAASTAKTSAATITAASTADTSNTTITAETTADTSAATITAASTADTSATTNTAASTTKTSATTNTAASTTKTSAAINTAASTADTSAIMKSGANFSNFHVLLLLNLLALNYLII